MQTDGNQIVTFLMLTTGLVLFLTTLIIMLVYMYKNKQLVHLQNVEALKHDHMKSLMSTQLEMQENTFEHISKEIHDNISLSLTLAKLNLNTLNFNDTAEGERKVSFSIELISRAISNLSNISKSLNSDIISSHGLSQAIEEEIYRIRRTGLLAVDYDISGDPVYMEAQREVIIFRIVQEAFNNIIKHSKASHASLQLKYHSDVLTINISDNGVGFDASETAIAQSTRSGLRNMQTRAKVLNGNMAVTSSIGKGTTLTFNIPIIYGQTNILD